MKKQIIEISNKLGFDKTESKNPYMISFVNKEKDIHINVYFTTMTILVLFYKTRENKMYQNVSLEEYEKILYDSTL